MDYTVIGDKANPGARLESLTIRYNNLIIMSEYTCDKVKNIFPINELGFVTVNGKQQPVATVIRDWGFAVAREVV
jgi:class 3 adenylate cyclase